MAVKKTTGNIRPGSIKTGNVNSGKNASGKAALPRSPWKTVLLVVAVIAAAAVFTGIVFCVFMLPKILLTENPRFELHHVIVESPGYWQKNAELLRRRLKLERGSNIFALDPAEIRNELMRVQNIENAEVNIVLPDTLLLKLVERVPRAVLFNARTNIVVDENGFTMKRSESTAARQALPVISGLRANKDVRKQLMPALKLIMTALNDFQDIAIRQISVAGEYNLEVLLYYREHKRCIVLFPVDGDFSYLLMVLQSAIIDAARNGDDRDVFDLSSRGKVFISSSKDRKIQP